MLLAILMLASPELHNKHIENIANSSIAYFLFLLVG